MSGRLAAAIALATLGLRAAPARAQHCHVPVDAPRPVAAHAAPRAWWLGVVTSATAGATELMGERIAYQGAALTVEGGWRRLAGFARVPMYAVSERGVGVGDVLAGGSVTVLARDPGWRAGLSAAASAATGDVGAGRGMGHRMVVGGAWVDARRGRVRLQASSAVAVALGDGVEHVAHGHGATSWPLVDPMSPREVVSTLTTSVAVGPGAVGAGLTHGAPIGEGGETRLVPAVIGELGRGRTLVRLQAGVPVIGSPFLARAVLEVGFRY